MQHGGRARFEWDHTPDGLPTLAASATWATLPARQSHMRSDAKLLRENRFPVDPAYLPRALSIPFAALMNSPFRWCEECPMRMNSRCVRRRIAGEWRRCFEEWGYSL